METMNIKKQDDKNGFKKFLRSAGIGIAAVAMAVNLYIPKANAWYNNGYVPTNPNNISSPYSASTTVPAIVEGERAVSINYNNNAGAEGAGVGAIIGGVLGRKNIFTEIGGAIAGGIIGGPVGKYLARGPGTMVIVRYNNGVDQTITEPGRLNFYKGEPVFVIQSQSGRVRVIPRN
ncbi:MAG: hypothetical protein M1331_01865 [Candidatus Marsarchaeota archaeon]|nr:hypothetical protein [Candidatus Marsarchaeota archaeon]